MPSIFSKLLLGLAVIVGSGFSADNSLGTWKLDLAKSKYTPAPPPVKSLNVTREEADGGVKVTTTGEQTDGTAISATYTAKFDAKEVPVSGNAPYDMIAVKQSNANTFTDERRKSGGQYKATGRTMISNGGKTMTTTIRGTNSEGKPFTAVLVFDKQ